MKITIPAIFTILAIATLGCKSNSSDTNDTALAMLEEVRVTLQTSPAHAIELLDSIDAQFKTDAHVLKQSMNLRPKAIEQLTLRQISSADSLLKAKKADIESLRAQMQWVKEPRMIDGYYVAKTAYNPNFLNTTGIEARVSDIGRFYLVSSANPGNKHTSITVSDGNTSATTGEMPYDGESNYRVGGGEVITFSPEKSDTIGKYAIGKTGSATLLFNGKGKTSRKLSARDLDAISIAYRYSQAVETARNTDIELQRLHKQLEIARAQQQRLAEKSLKE